MTDMKTEKSFAGLFHGAIAALFCGIGLVSLMGSNDSIVVAEGSMPTISENLGHLEGKETGTPLDKGNHLSIEDGSTMAAGKDGF
jgi:hypothetical protein